MYLQYDFRLSLIKGNSPFELSFSKKRLQRIRWKGTLLKKTLNWIFSLMKKNYSRIFILILFIAVSVLSGCQPLNQESVPQAPKNEQILPTSTTIVNNLPVVMGLKSDMTMVCGRVVHPDGKPVGNLNIRLAEVYYGEPGSEGAFVLNTSSSPSAMTNEEGYFCTAEIAVTDYVLVVGNPEENYEIYSEEDKKAVVWSPLAGEVLDLGEIITAIETNP